MEPQSVYRTAGFHGDQVPPVNPVGRWSGEKLVLNRLMLSIWKSIDYSGILYHFNLISVDCLL